MKNVKSKKRIVHRNIRKNQNKGGGDGFVSVKKTTDGLSKIQQQPESDTKIEQSKTDTQIKKLIRDRNVSSIRRGESQEKSEITSVYNLKGNKTEVQEENNLNIDIKEFIYNLNSNFTQFIEMYKKDNTIISDKIDLLNQNLKIISEKLK